MTLPGELALVKRQKGCLSHTQHLWQWLSLPLNSLTQPANIYVFNCLRHAWSQVVSALGEAST